MRGTWRQRIRRPRGGIFGHPAPTIPPADWRMPATVASDIAGGQAALAPAQASAASKARPSVVVANGETRYAEWTMGAAGTLLYSQIVTSDGAATALTRNGADLGFTAYGTQTNKRNGLKLAVAAGDVIRATWQANGANRTIYPLLHAIPATGAFDAYLLDGASREEAHGSLLFENSVIGQFAARDPVIFNRAQSGATIDGIAAGTAAKAATYAGMVDVVLLGTIAGNNVTNNRPYGPAQKANIDAALDTIFASYAAFKIVMSNTSYRQYPAPNPVTPDAQGDGALPYNDAILHPYLAAHLPEYYDAALKRSRIDEYLEVLFDRANLNGDGIHSSANGYTNVRALWTDRYFRYRYTGAWGTAQIEKRIAGAEGAASDGSSAAVARAAFNEATYALLALEVTTAKTALQARLNTALPDVLFKEADTATAAAEAAGTQPAKDAAQAATDALVAAEGTSARAQGLQTRIDAIVIGGGSTLQTVLIRCGNGGALAGWNNADERTPPDATTWIDDLLNDQGAATGWSYGYTDGPESGAQTWTGVSTQAPGVSSIDWVPNAITARALNKNSINDTGKARWHVSGLDPAKLYDIDFYASRTGGIGRNTVFMVNEVALPQLDAGNNLSSVASATGIMPIDGTIEMAAHAGNPNNSFAYLTAIRIRERLA